MKTKETKAAFTARRAREIVSSRPSIVRHRDDDPRNNDIGNLRVEPALAAPLLRYAAIRPEVDVDGAATGGPDRVDLSTLSISADYSRRLADREDERNRKQIRNGTARAHLRIARVEIREVR